MKIRILHRIVLLIVLVVSLPGFGKARQKPFFFIQLTDTQMGFLSANKQTEEEKKLYSETVAFINKVKPDFVAITGDFVNNRKDTSQINAFKKITATINKKIPVYLIPGNHDMGQKPTPEHIQFYFSHYPADRFNFTHKQVQFIGINSCLINSGIGEEQSQFEELQRVLQDNKPGYRRIIFSHHPFFIQSIDEKDSYSNIGQQYRTQYMDLFAKSNVVAVFAGHYHNNAEASYKGIQMITTSAVGKQLGKAKSGFRIVKVYPDKIEHNYVELDSLPEKVKL